MLSAPRRRREGDVAGEPLTHPPEAKISSTNSVCRPTSEIGGQIKPSLSLGDNSWRGVNGREGAALGALELLASSVVRPAAFAGSTSGAAPSSSGRRLGSLESFEFFEFFESFDFFDFFEFFESFRSCRGGRTTGGSSTLVSALTTPPLSPSKPPTPPLPCVLFWPVEVAIPGPFSS